MNYGMLKTNASLNVKTMRMFITPFLFQAVFMISCQSHEKSASVKHPMNDDNSQVSEYLTEEKETIKVVPSGNTIIERFKPLYGFMIAEDSKNSFAYYLSHLPLKEMDAPVHLFNGQLKQNQTAQASVVEMEIGKKDLQQCADAVMRLRAEYLFANKEFEDIHFTFTNGFSARYAHWRAGNRIKVVGNKCTWVSTSQESTSYSSFRDYLEIVFSYAGTLSLSRQLKKVSNLDDLKAGDVFIRGGSPGHAVIVVQVAMHSKTGKKMFMIAQSYMPAQEIHVLKNPSNISLSPWYAMEDIEEYFETPEYTFSRNELMRF